MALGLCPAQSPPVSLAPVALARCGSHLLTTYEEKAAAAAAAGSAPYWRCELYPGEGAVKAVEPA